MAQITNDIKLFANETRLRILNLLKFSPMYVTQISDVLNIYQSKLSHQLSILREGKLISSKKKGKKITYSLNICKSKKPLFNVICKSFNNGKVFKQDLKKAKKVIK